MTTTTQDLHRTTGLERWLTSRPRLALAGLAFVVLATLATSMGEVELLRASDMDTADAETAILVQSGAIWLAWALVTPLLLAVAFLLARRTRHALLAALCHLPIAFTVGSAFLAGEIALQDSLQSEDDTAAYRRMVERRGEERAGGGPPEGRRGGRDGRGPERADPDSPDAARRDRQSPVDETEARALPTSRGDRQGERPEEATAERTAERMDRNARGERREGGGRPGAAMGPPPPSPGGEGADRERRAERRRREGRWGGRRSEDIQRFRRMARGVTANVSTGDFAADFERRWRLRVPRYGLVYLALIAIGLGCRAYLVGRQREREALDLELRTERLETELTEARLTALKGQLHPHFLFNALHSVGGLIRSSDGDRALTALAQIGDLLRTSLDAGGEQFVTLSRELELVRRYLDVEALRLGERLQVEIEVDPRLVECEVPAFITQPLVENAIKHGIAELVEGGRVSLVARSLDGESLEVVVENDGPPVAEEREDGVGMEHVRTRLATLFEDAGSLTLETRPSGDGARAVLLLPLDDVDDLPAPRA